MPPRPPVVSTRQKKQQQSQSQVHGRLQSSSRPASLPSSAPSPYLQPLRAQQRQARQQQAILDDMSAAELRVFRERREGRFENDLDASDVTAAAHAALAAASAASSEAARSSGGAGGGAATASSAPPVSSPLHDTLRRVVLPLLCLMPSNDQDGGDAGADGAPLFFVDEEQLNALWWVLADGWLPTSAPQRQLVDAACASLFSIVLRLLVYCVSLDCAIDQVEDEQQQQEQGGDDGDSSGDSDESPEMALGDLQDQHQQLQQQQTGGEDKQDLNASGAAFTCFRVRHLAQSRGITNALRKLCDISASPVPPLVRAAPDVALPVAPASASAAAAMAADLFSPSSLDAICFFIQCATEMGYPRLPAFGGTLFHLAACDGDEGSSAPSSAATPLVARSIVGELTLFMCWLCRRYDLPRLVRASLTVLRAQSAVGSGGVLRGGARPAADTHEPLSSLLDLLVEDDACAFWLRGAATTMPSTSSTFARGLTSISTNHQHEHQQQHQQQEQQEEENEFHRALDSLDAELSRHEALKRHVEPFRATDVVLSASRHARDYGALKLYFAALADMMSSSGGVVSPEADAVRELAETAALASLSSAPSSSAAAPAAATTAIPRRSYAHNPQCGPAAAAEVAVDQRLADVQATTAAMTLEQLGAAAGLLHADAHDACARLSHRVAVDSLAGSERGGGAEQRHQRVAHSVAADLSQSSLSEFVRVTLEKLATEPLPPQQPDDGDGGAVLAAARRALRHQSGESSAGTSAAASMLVAELVPALKANLLPPGSAALSQLRQRNCSRFTANRRAALRQQMLDLDHE